MERFEPDLEPPGGPPEQKALLQFLKGVQGFRATPALARPALHRVLSALESKDRIKGCHRAGRRCGGGPLRRFHSRCETRRSRLFRLSEGIGRANAATWFDLHRRGLSAAAVSD